MSPAEFKKLNAEVGGRHRNREEEHAQMAVIDWVALNETRYPALKMLFHSPNGGHRDVRVAVKLKRMGVRRGVPDLMLPVIRTSNLFPPGKTCQCVGLAIEMKSGPGMPTPEQAAYGTMLQAQCWKVVVCHSAPEAIAEIKSYLGIP